MRHDQKSTENVEQVVGWMPQNFILTMGAD